MLTTHVQFCCRTKGVIWLFLWITSVKLFDVFKMAITQQKTSNV